MWEKNQKEKIKNAKYIHIRFTNPPDHHITLIRDEKNTLYLLQSWQGYFTLEQWMGQANHEIIANEVNGKINFEN